MSKDKLMEYWNEAFLNSTNRKTKLSKVNEGLTNAERVDQVDKMSNSPNPLYAFTTGPDTLADRKGIFNMAQVCDDLADVKTELFNLENAVNFAMTYNDDKTVKTLTEKMQSLAKKMEDMSQKLVEKSPNG